MLSNNYSSLILDTVEDLSPEKQQEVYDFANFLKLQRITPADPSSSLEDIIGLFEGPANLSSKHDEIYDR
ncbi:MAG: hypothetical protein A2293_01570 [Elusimicrobia bacterium RIFOXYB2_FULL_49_7]|nr:MAG: hypothetical protein A2293_01570 [Elusimicrobia bacterium RIFOXYB2_FULL_49_7]